MKVISVALVVALLGLAACAERQAQLEVESAWARATVRGQKTSAAYMHLKSAQGATLVGAESPVARIVELHEMRMDDNVMRMRAVPKLDLPAGKTIEFKPGGFHFMLIDLKQPLGKGDSVPITLKIEGKDNTLRQLEVKAEVRDQPPR
ncbi:MAG: copper chaperone PCu(A)C [Betaproteobacteria bacterium]|nr:copper chaperone PCu(A)C [Betaproteobacteria bacterium]